MTLICPKCGNENSFQVEVTALLKMDGQEQVEGSNVLSNYDGKSTVICDKCEYNDYVSVFRDEARKVANYAKKALEKAEDFERYFRLEQKANEELRKQLKELQEAIDNIKKLNDASRGL